MEKQKLEIRNQKTETGSEAALRQPWRAFGMPQFRARSAGLQPGILANADLKVGATSAAGLETGALPLLTFAL
jgi:hypothetical protein